MSFLKKRIAGFLFRAGACAADGGEELSEAAYRAAFLKYVSEGAGALSQSEKQALATRGRRA